MDGTEQLLGWLAFEQVSCRSGHQGIKDEAPRRNDVRNPNNPYWRSRWNIDSDPHFAEGNWQGNPSWINTLDE